MAHISIPEGIPGIVGLMTTYPETAQPLNALAQTLLRGESSLTPAERELIATYVSHRNQCKFCTMSHAAATRYMYDHQQSIVDDVLRDPETAPVDERMKALLAIAGRVQQGGRSVLPEHVERARNAGADDKAIHDTVLTAAAFCMFNRYVDGLATWAPEDTGAYEQVGARLATRGYGQASD